MPHRRHYLSKRNFPDGQYQLLSSHWDAYGRDKALEQYRKEDGPKLRYLKGEDGKYHIYEKVEDAST